MTDNDALVREKRLWKVICSLEAMSRNYAGGHMWDHLDGEMVCEAAALLRDFAALRSTPQPDLVQDETGWLIELPITASGGGRLCWVGIEEGAPFPRFHTLRHDEDYDFQKIASPLKFTVDSNDALRFARKIDAERFAEKFSNYLLHAVVTEHAWTADAELIAQAKPLDPPAQDVLATAVAQALYGSNFDPFLNPEAWDFCEKAATATIAALDRHRGTDALREENARLRFGLQEAAEALFWAARQMKGNCSGRDISATNLAGDNARRAALDGGAK